MRSTWQQTTEWLLYTCGDYTCAPIRVCFPGVLLGAIAALWHASFLVPTQRRAVRGDGDIADQQSPRPPVHHALLKIPADACDAYKRTAGLHVRPEAVAKCSVHAPTSAAAALFENNGYFKCRNESHWASPCLRIDRRHD
eukprot:m.323254 g.323254  ORF g.323254 m.323254 type:complete len:140 (-) comp20358_c0_seq28:2271-2690(-)